jgi:hypothetical protein
MLVRTTDGILTEFDASHSKVLQELLNDVTPTETMTVPIQVDSASLEAIKLWMTNEDPIEEDWATLWRMAHSADYLNMSSMLERTCRSMAEKLRNKSPTEIRALLEHLG